MVAERKALQRRASAASVLSPAEAERTVKSAKAGVRRVQRELDRASTRSFSVLDWELVSGKRLRARNLRECRVDLPPSCPCSATLEVLLGHQCSELLCGSGTDELVERDPLTLRNLGKLAVEGFREPQAECRHRLPSLKVKEKLSRCKHADSQCRGWNEVAQVVGDDGVCTTRHRQFHDHVVVGVVEQRAPQEEHVLLVSDQAEVVDERGHVARTLAGRHVPQERGFVLDHQRDGDRYLESIGTKQANELEGGPKSRPPCRDQDRRVEHDQHAGVVSRAIPLDNQPSADCATGAATSVYRNHAHPRAPSVKSSVGKALLTRASAAAEWSPAEAERTVKSAGLAFGGCNVSWTAAETTRQT